MRRGVKCTLGAVLAAGFFCAAGLFLPGTHLHQTLLAPVGQLTHAVRQWSQAFTEKTELLQREKALQQRVAALSLQLEGLRTVEAENARLRVLLGFAQRHTDYQLLAGEIVAHSGSNWTQALTVNRGTAQGVQEGICAVTETGALAGVVTDAGGDWCVLTPVTSPEFALGVCGENHLSLLASGSLSGMELGTFSVENLRRAEDLSVGDVLYTVGNVQIPAGLEVGTVTSCTCAPSGLEWEGTAVPSAPAEELTQIYFIIDFEQAG